MTVIDRVMNNEEMFAHAADFLKPINRHGIMAMPYARGPLGNSTFTIGLDSSSEVLRLWPGTATMNIVDMDNVPSPQIVLRCTEGDHAINVPVEVGSGSIYWSSRKAPVVNPNALVSTTFPSGTTFDYAKEWTKTEPNRTGRFSWKNTVAVTVPAFDNSFLIGYDEVKCFISQLPEHAASVKEAHRMLRPLGVGPKARRQGEWFFAPCSQAEVKTLQDHMKRSKGNRIHADSKKLTPIERGSTHCMTNYVTIGETHFVRGEIIDTRALRHHSLNLEGWHRVVRNNEITAQEDRQDAARSTRTRWD